MPARYYPEAGAPFDLVVSFSPGASISAPAVDGEEMADVDPTVAETRFALAAATSDDEIEVAGARWRTGVPRADGGGFIFVPLRGPIGERP